MLASHTYLTRPMYFVDLKDNLCKICIVYFLIKTE